MKSFRTIYYLLIVQLKYLFSQSQYAPLRRVLYSAAGGSIKGVAPYTPFKKKSTRQKEFPVNRKHAFSLVLIPLIFVLSCGASQKKEESVISKVFEGKELLHEGVNRIYIEKITNGSINATIPETLSSSLRRRINLEGRLTVIDDRSLSDAILKVKIVKFRSEPFNYDSSGRPEKKRLRIDSLVSLTYTSTGKEKIRQSEVYAENIYTLTGSVTASEYREISDLTDNLSQKIISVISTGWYKED